MKTVIIGISGSIAAYKMGYVASGLVQRGIDTHVMMTENAAKFIGPVTFETLTKNLCFTDTFDRRDVTQVHHVALAKKADVIMIAPATANIISKLASGICDDMLTSLVMAAKCHKIIAPAMNENMYLNQVTQDNLEKLKAYGWEVVDPAVGYLACGDIGPGKMPEPDTLLAYIDKALSDKKDLSGLNVLITAGAGREALDPVRFISNRSTGKMGFALAAEAARRGAKVTVVKGFTTAKIPDFVEIVQAESAEEMFKAVTERAKDADIIIKAAAVADYKPLNYSNEKIKKKEGDLSIPLERTQDILKYLGEHKTSGQFICGFSMETENVIENTQKKLEKKNVDMMVANNLKEAGSGFGTDTNGITIITPEGVYPQEMSTKDEVAGIILDYIMARYKRIEMV